MKVWKEFSFEAAHSLPDVRMGAPNQRIHGHSYCARVTVRGPIRDDGMVVSMEELQAAVDAVRFRLDHMHLNAVLATPPTLEHLTEFIAASFHIGDVVRVDVWRPTCGDGATWEREP